MSNKVIKHKPLTNDEYNKLIKLNEPLINLSLNTGARIMEIKRLIDYYNGKNTIDIKTKKSGESKNRFYLNKISMESLEKLQSLKNVSKRTISNKYKEISNKSKVNFTSHNLRATFATKLLEMGVDLVTVSRLMNHGEINQTAKYIQFVESRFRTAVDLLENYETISGMTIFELHEDNVKKQQIIMKLENKIKEMKGNK